MNQKDFNGNKIKDYMEFECCEHLTVGELKKRLVEYSDDAFIYMEASNSSNHGDIWWSQKALDTYPCKRKVDKNCEKALMIVGSVR